MTSAVANAATIHSSTSLFPERAAIIARVAPWGNDKFESVDSGSGLVPGDEGGRFVGFVAYIDDPGRGCDDWASCPVATPKDEAYPMEVPDRIARRIPWTPGPPRDAEGRSFS